MSLGSLQDNQKRSYVESPTRPSSTAQEVVSIQHGLQPDGDYVPVRVNGSATSTQTLLGGTSLNGAITDTATTITVDSTAGFSSSGFVKINDEIISYTGITSTTLTGCTRGVEQTAAASHVDNTDCGETYISPWIDTDGFNSIEVFIKSDVRSSFLGLEVQFTDDANAITPTVRASENYTYTNDDVTRGFEDIRIGTILDGFRVIYANDGTTQSSFILDTVLRTTADNNRYNRGGGLLTTEFDTEVALGLVSNYVIDTKFGRVKGPDQQDNPVDIWALADDGLSNRLNTKTFPTVASEFFLASSSVSDTAVTVRVVFIDNIGVEREEDVILNGRTPVSLGFVALDVNRMTVVSSTGAAGNIYCATSGSFTAGVPTTPSQTVSYIQAGYNQTQMTQLTVPAKKRLIIKSFTLAISRDSGASGSGIATLRIKPQNQASVIKREFFPTTGTPVDKTRANIVVEPLSQIVWRLDDVSDSDTNCSCIWDYEAIDD